MKHLVVREYLRVSQDRSGTGKSPNQQHDEMVEGAQRQGWVLHPHPYRDTDRSASRYARKTREGFAELMADLEEDRFSADMLGIWESSRGSRRTGEWLDLIELCAERDVRIWVLTHGRVYDPTNARDRRSLREDASDAEYESDKTSERLRRDMRANALKGRPHGKQIYGYERVYDHSTGQLVGVIEHPEHGPVVREAARRVLAGEAYYAIAKDFNARGIPPRRRAFTSRREVLGWTPPAVKQMLSMPAYAGLRQHQGKILEDVQAIWPPLIEPEAWHRLQAVMAGRSQQGANTWPAKHLLGGIAECAVCGSGTRIGKQNAGKQQYDKETREKLPRRHYNAYLCHGTPGKTGFHVAMREEHLDLLVTEVVLARLQRPDFLARVGQEDEGVDEQREALLEEIRAHKAWLDDVAKQAAKDKDLGMLTEQRALILPQIDAAQKQLEALARTDPLIIELAGADDVEARWQELSIVERRQVIRLLVTPRIKPVGKGWRGKKGVNRERVEFAWK
ncbi:recombinase family protein [Microbacterium sp. NPDC055903]